MENEKNYTIEDIITSIKNKEPIEVEKAFSDVLSTKLKTSLDTRKQELAKSVFSPELEIDSGDSVEAESGDAVEEEADFLEKVIKKKKRKGSDANKARKKARQDYKKMPKSKKKKIAKKAKKVARTSKNTVKMVGNFDPSEELDYGDDEDI